MAAKHILRRYLERNNNALPTDPLKLREQLASVAEKSRLKITEKELDELVPTTAPKKAKAAPRKSPKKKGDSSTT